MKNKKYYENVLELIGHTPLIKLKSFSSKIYAKVELFNPSGSNKARIALAMIEGAQENHLINKDTIIIEPTSGNTGIALAMVCSIKGLKFIAVMPETMSIERRKLIYSYGGEIVLSKGNLGMEGAKQMVETLKQKYKLVFVPSQFENKFNPLTHFLNTGPEILNSLPEIDCFVSGIGTGGTISGVGRYLKEHKKVHIVGVEPLSSPLLTKGYSSSHNIQGIGPNFIPETLDLSVIDEIRDVSDEDAITYSRLIANQEGLFVGISSGAALKVAHDLSKEGAYHHIVVLLPDTGERYLSIL